MTDPTKDGVSAPKDLSEMFDILFKYHSVTEEALEMQDLVIDLIKRKIEKLEKDYNNYGVPVNMTKLNRIEGAIKVLKKLGGDLLK